MIRLIIVAPTQQIYEIAENIVANAGIEATVLRCTSENVVRSVREAFGGDAGVVVARGNHAHLLKSETSYPVVDIIINGQELAECIGRACRMLSHPRPRIALAGFRYMFSNPEPIARLLDAEVDIYYASGSAAMEATVERAFREGKELIIGGELACAHAERLGLKSVFLSAQRSSVHDAVRMAVQMLRAMNAEREKSLEFRSLMDHSFDAIFRLDAEGRITALNELAEKAFNSTANQLIGQPFLSLPGLEAVSDFRNALQSRRSLYSCALRIGNASFVARVACIEGESEQAGFIITMQEFGIITNLEEQIRLQRINRGYVAQGRFEDASPASARAAALLDDARQYAQYDVPLLLAGPAGTRLRWLAECVHNASFRRMNPFVVADLSSIPPSEQLEALFGNRSSGPESLIALAQKGTLLLSHVDLLEPEAQYCLQNLLQNGRVQLSARQTASRPDVRVLCATHRDLRELCGEGRFLPPLAQTLERFRLDVPPLRERREDLPDMIRRFMRRQESQYKKSVRFSADAMEALLRYDWPENDRSLEELCARATLLAREREIRLCDLPAFLRAPASPDAPVLLVVNPEERALRQALQDAGGNRAAAAEALGVSRSTLWRRMRKYGVGLP